LMRQLNAYIESSNADPSAPHNQALKWNTEFDEVRVPLTAEWDGLNLTARQVSRLKVGDVIPLDPQFATKTKVRLARVAKFLGRLGRQDDKWAVEITNSTKA